VQPEITWQPLPDTLLNTAPTDPAAIVVSRGSLRLALIAALQHLPPRQRAVLILRDVLGWRAAEVAELLGTTTVAVKSTLQRARAQLDQVAPVEDEIVESAGLDHQVLLDQYMAAFENVDIAALLRLLRQDAELEMPPLLTWFTGREAVGRFIGSHVFVAPDAMRMVPTRGNGQPAVAAYLRDHDGIRAHAVQVLTATATGIARIVAFLDPNLFARFGLPQVHPTAAVAASTRPH
jgi:RNA polymerase sigma-70 factor (ECF subfamily)